MDDPITDPLIGTEVAGYRITSLIGRGGMGVVYRAENAVGAPVAIKVMAPEISGNPEFRERFMRESESTIDHPNVVPVYETGRSGELLYLVMQLIEGSDLKSIIETEGRLLPTRAGAIFVQAAAALDAAHENGIVHRDVKPQNILVESSNAGDQVYLTDFGLVKRASSQSSLTSSVFLMGSAYYMAPEHIEGKTIDGRVDVYGLGCVLYESLTGCVPFEKENEVAVLWAHVNEPPPSVTRKVPVLGSGIDAIVAKALAKSADDRYLTAGEFASAVASELGAPVGRRALWAQSGVRGSGPKPKVRSGPRPRQISAPAPTPRHVKAALAAALVAIVGLSSFAAAGRGRRPDERADPSLGVTARQGDPSRRSSERSANRGDLRGTREAGRLDPWATQNVLLASATEGASSDLGAMSEHPTVSGELPEVLDHRRWRRPKIAFNHGDGIYVMNPDGSARKRFIANARWPAWSPDGRRIAFVGQQWRLFVADADGNRVRKLGGRTVGVAPAWTPDGKNLVYVRPTKNGNNVLHIISARGGRSRPFLIEGREIVGWASPDWSPDGTRLAVSPSSQSLRVEAVDGSESFQLARGWGASWSADGNWIVYSEFDAPTGMRLHIIRPDGSDDANIHPLKLETFSAYDPQWSPGGTSIVFHALDLREMAVYCCPSSIFVMGLTDDEPKDLGPGSYPSWQPVLR